MSIQLTQLQLEAFENNATMFIFLIDVPNKAVFTNIEKAMSDKLTVQKIEKFLSHGGMCINYREYQK